MLSGRTFERTGFLYSVGGCRDGSWSLLSSQSPQYRYLERSQEVTVSEKTPLEECRGAWERKNPMPVGFTANMLKPASD
jgi:hypothetical protein